VLENTPENLARWIADPQGVKPGNFMPDLFAEDDPGADEDIRALVAYLESLGTQ
jgi:cytochrome c oxidase subunit 2